MKLSKSRQEKLAAMGVDPETGEVLETNNEEANNAEEQRLREDSEAQEQGDESAESGSEWENDGDEPERGESEENSDGQVAAESEPESDDFDLDEVINNGGQGMATVPVSLLKKLKKQAKKDDAGDSNNPLQDKVNNLESLLNNLLSSSGASDPSQTPSPSQSEAPTEQEPVPDMLLDSDAYNAWVLKQINSVKGGTSDEVKQLASTIQEMRTEAIIKDTESEYEKENPGYRERKQRYVDAEVEKQLIFVPDSQKSVAKQKLKDQYKQRERQFAAQLVQNGMNPAERFDELFKRAGIVSKQGQVDLKAVNKNSKKQRTLSDAGNAKKMAGDTVDLAKYANMSKEESKKFIAQLKKEGKFNEFKKRLLAEGRKQAGSQL